MRNIAAYILLVVGGNATPSAEDVTAVITACGGSVDEASLASLISDLEGKSLAELMV
jgi:large subunit ribosomal protein LP2